MTLNELFDSINMKVGTVYGIVDSLQDPIRTYIDQNLTSALYFYGEMQKWHTSSYDNLDKFTDLTIKYLLVSYGQLVKEYDDKISDIRLGIDQAFNSYYRYIVNELETAISLTWNEIEESETYLLGQIEAAKNEVINTMAGQLNEVDTRLGDRITVIEDMLIGEEESLWDKILAVGEKALDDLTTAITDITATVSGWIDDLWTYVGTIVEDLATKFSQFWTQITDWVSETLTSIRERITREVNKLMISIESFYRRAESLVNTAKAWLVSEINRLGETLRGLIDAAIRQVQDLLDDLALLTDWRFAFFNLSLSFPELGFLQVLNRDDETFKRFKPYWQALFARVMEEE